MEKKKAKLNMLTMLLLIGLVPLILTLVITILVTASMFKNSLLESNKSLLSTSANMLNQYFGYDWTEWVAKGVDGISDTDRDFIDSGKSEDVEMTVFKKFEDDGKVKRYLSSIIDSSTGKRAFNTTTADDITAAVMGGQTVFREGVVIAGKTYTVCYKPIYDENHKIVGMAFAGKPDSAISQNLGNLSKQLIFISVIVAAIFGAIIFFVARMVIKPLALITKSTELLADGDITTEIEARSTLTETNALITADVTLRDSLNKIVGDIRMSAQNLRDTVTTTKELCSDASSGASVVDTTVGELAQTASSLADTIQNLNENIIGIGNSIESIASAVNALSESSDQMNKISDASAKDIIDVYNASEESVDAATNISSHMDKLTEAISRVTAATDMISSIASQTRLLSLNASIEAARAGEAGRGFAVVAGEIGTLASNSADSVNQINSIVQDILALSAESSKVTEEIRAIIAGEQEKVRKTQESFKQLKDQIDASVRQIALISEDTKQLTVAKSDAVSAVSDLGAISEENAASCEECSASVSNIANTIEEVNDKTNDIEKAADALDQYIKAFR